MKSLSKIYLYSCLVFLVISLVGFYITERPVEPQNIVARVTKNLNEELNHVDEAAAQLLSVLKRDPRTSLPTSDRFSFYIIDATQVLVWSDHTFVPSPIALADNNTIKLVKSGSSDYLIKKWPLSEKFLVAVIPLYKRYPITNDYLKTQWNNNVFPPGNISILEPNANLGIPVCVQNVCAFKISFIPGELNVYATARVVTLLFSMLCFIALILFLLDWVKSFHSPEIGFLVLTSALVALRLTMTYLNFPANLLPGDLFDPTIFAASSLNASLGDLLLNEIALFVVCLYIFRALFHFKLIKSLNNSGRSNALLSVVAGVCVLFAMLFPFVVIQTIYNNSSIALDLSTSLQFDGIRIAAFFAVLVAGICSFLFSHTFIRLLIGDGKPRRILLSFLISVIVFVVLQHFTNQEYLSSLILGVVYFIVVYALRLYSSLRRLSFITFFYLFITILFISANGALSMYHFSKKEKIENQFRFARNFLVDRDYFGEYLLRELSKRISNDIFIQSRVSNPFFNKDAVRQKIRQVFLSNYFNKYDVKIYIFNASGDHIDNRFNIAFQDLVSRYNRDAYKTEYEGVYFVSSPAADITQKYLVVVPLIRMKTITGHIVLELSLKKVIPENVYPELLVDNRFLQFYRAQDISYGVFVNGKLSYSAGFFNYEGSFNTAWMGDPLLHTNGISKAGYDHIAQEDEYGRVAVVSARSIGFTLALADFSFLLVLGLITILVFILVQGALNYMGGDKLFFSARIQLFLNLAFFLPLIIVSVMTLRVTTRSSQNQIREEYLNKAKKFSEQIASDLDEGNRASEVRQVSFENTLADLAQLSNLDVNVYTRYGSLVATSQPLIFENNLLSNYINASALAKVNNGNSVFIETEHVGTLQYFTAYAALKTPTTGDLIGIIGIPFFQSLYSLEKIQINILANILNIFSLIFIGLVALSYVVTKWLTFPLTFITQSLRKTSLTKINQPLVWQSDDEIGLMVKEYNQMLFKLSESKAELEQTQRERAWRDIAQQVAHEIKNPLTPMKLTLQQLERQIQGGNHVAEKMQKAISSLLIQVNTLDDIASSFSSFAKMPEPVMKSLELVSLLQRIIHLHSHTGELVLENNYKEVFIKGDEQLLGRTFSNLILNAIQAASPGEPAYVFIGLEKKAGKILLSFRDNGKGIEAAVAEQIFIPHFTTKKSGSGLGLAIAKQGIEHMQGKIWFETSIGDGTTFFIELPELN